MSIAHHPRGGTSATAAILEAKSAVTISRSGNVVLAALATCLVGLSLWQIRGPLRMVRVEAVAIEGTPATIFRPTVVPHLRWPLLAIMLVGTTAFFTADEWATRGEGAARFGPAGAKVAFVLSLAFAVALDCRSLFFLIITVPVIVTAFVVGGLFSAWIDRRTHRPLIGGFANAALLAWALGVTFPNLAT